MGNMPKKIKPTSQNSTIQRAGKGWTRGFLAALSRNGNVTKSAELVHLSRRYVYQYRADHPEFAAQWDDALEESWDRLEHEARRRAQFGTLKPIYYKGQFVNFEQEFSDQLMTLLLKAKRPAEFGDKLTIKITAEQAAVIKAEGLTPDEAWAQFVEMIRTEASVDDHSAD